VLESPSATVTVATVEKTQQSLEDSRCKWFSSSFHGFYLLCAFLVSTIHLDQMNERLNRMEILLMNVLSQAPDRIIANGNGTVTGSNPDSLRSDNSISENNSMVDFVENFIRPQVHELSMEISLYRSNNEVNQLDESASNKGNVVTADTEVSSMKESYPVSGNISSENSFHEDNENYYREESETKSLFDNQSPHDHLSNHPETKGLEGESDEERYSLASESPEEVKAMNEFTEDSMVEKSNTIDSSHPTNGEDSNNPELVYSLGSSDREV
jgi:hypothetical protein